MDNYGVSVENKYSLFLDDVSDPYDILANTTVPVKDVTKASPKTAPVSDTRANKKSAKDNRAAPAAKPVADDVNHIKDRGWTFIGLIDG